MGYPRIQWGHAIFGMACHASGQVRSGHEYHSTTTYLEDSSKARVFLVER